MKHTSVILIEFNELSPSLMARFIDEGRLPNFKRLRQESEVYVTDAEERAPFLEPWIQWITVHSGKTYREHGIFNLSDGHRLQEKCLWDVLSDEGFKVWVCGSMNVRYDRPINGLVLPDPWATEIGPSDRELRPYFDFVRSHVLEYTNDSARLGVAKYAAFASFMARRGLSLETVRDIAEQLWNERRHGQGRWKRAVILDKLQFDVFRWYYKKMRPSFSTFFLNSTAHFQHLYWRNMDPQSFQVKPTTVEQAQYESAIRFGYEEMDRLIGRFYELSSPNTTLVFCTALSQQPFLKYEADGGKIYYRPRDCDSFVRLAGVTKHVEVIPVMSQNFHVRFKTDEDAAEGVRLLSRLSVGDRPLLIVHQHGNSIHAGCGIYASLPKDATIVRDEASPPVPFFEHFYRIEGMKSGMHHPDGLLWVRRPATRHRVVEEKLPLTAVAPLILDMFGIAKPSYMSTLPVNVASVA
jgi:hypothetical protein